MDRVPTVSEIRTVNESRLEILSIKWSPDDSLLAVGCSDGSIKTYLTLNFRLFKLLNNSTATNMPVTSVCWRPETSTSDYSNILLAVSSDGWVVHWDVNTPTILDIFRLPGEQCLTADYSPDGMMFAVGCSDFTIKVYDAVELKVLNSMDFGTGEKPGHSNRIFAIKWVNPQILISGGWDDTIIMWDVRSQQALVNCYGPHVCGAAIDFSDRFILAGSYSRNEQVQCFDVSLGCKVTSKNLGDNEKPELIYALQYNKAGNKEFVCTVGTQINLFYSKSLEPFFSLGTDRESFCCDWAHLDNSVAIGNAGGYFKVYKID